MKRKILSTLLAISLVLSFMGAIASADSQLPENYEAAYEYFYSDFDGASLPVGFSQNSTGITLEELDGDTVAKFGVGGTTVNRLYTPPNMKNRNATEENPLNGLNDLVLEYRFKTKPGNESQSYFSYESDATFSNMIFMAAPSYSQTNSIAWKQGLSAFATLNSLSEWHTFSIVYPADSSSNFRKLYVDGVYYGESTDTDNSSANLWNKNGVARWAFRGYSAKKTAEFYLDYVKAYEKPSHFIAEIENAENTERDSIVLTFNNAFGASTLNTSAFNVTDGVKNISAYYIERINEKKVKIVLSELLDKNKTYTLNINGIKDNLSAALYNNSITFTTNNEDVFTSENIYYYNDFDSYMDFSRVVENEKVTYGLDTSSDGKSVFKVQGTDVYPNAGNADFRFPAIAPAAGDAPDELILEYKLKLSADDPASYLGTWIADERSKTVALARYENSKDKVFFHYTDTEPIDDNFTINTKEWNTITIVYPKNVQKRRIYINGTYLGESAEGARENTYASAGATTFTLLPDFHCSDDVLEVDYVKIYSKATNFDAKIINATTEGITLEFNTVPANITPECFSLSGGTEISDVRRIDDKTYILIPADSLTADSEYTLQISGLTDNLARALSSASIAFTPKALVSSQGQLYYFNDFTQSSDIGYTTTSCDLSTTTSSDGSGATVLKILNPGTAKASGFYYPLGARNTTLPITGSPELIFEYRVRVVYSSSTYGYFGTRSPMLTACINAKNTLSQYPNAASDITSINKSEWNTIKTVFSNKSNSRDIYLNGQYLGTFTDSDGSNPSNQYYATNNCASITMPFVAYLYNIGDYVELDYVKVYSVPDHITASNVTASEDLKTVYISFNQPVECVADNFDIGGQKPVSVTVADSVTNTYALNLQSKLKANKTYNVVLNGITAGQSDAFYDVLSLTTRAADSYTVSVSTNSANGVVSINGTVKSSETVAEDSDLKITIKPDIGYDAVVTVNNNAIVPDRFDNYTLKNIADDITVNVTYEEVAETPSSIETIRSTHTDGTAIWGVGILRKASSDYGFIAAKTTSNLNMDAVSQGNAFKIRANGTNRFGEYGVMIIDLKRILGTSYYIIPYAVYDETVVYGTAVAAKINN